MRTLEWILQESDAPDEISRIIDYGMTLNHTLGYEAINSKLLYDGMFNWNRAYHLQQKKEMDRVIKKEIERNESD